MVFDLVLDGASHDYGSHRVKIILLQSENKQIKKHFLSLFS
jgi:hypothetical protein